MAMFSAAERAPVSKSLHVSIESFITNFSAVFNLKIVEFEIELFDKHGADFTGPPSTIGMGDFKDQAEQLMEIKKSGHLPDDEN
jgi:hypothetical protein